MEAVTGEYTMTHTQTHIYTVYKLSLWKGAQPCSLTTVRLNLRSFVFFL